MKTRPSKVVPSQFRCSGEKKEQISEVTGNIICEIDFPSSPRLVSEMASLKRNWRNYSSGQSIVRTHKKILASLKKFTDNVNKAEFNRTCILETGSCITFFQQQWKKVSNFIDQLESLYETSQVLPVSKGIGWKPKGIVLIALPSNEVLESFVNSVFPALLAGNMVLIKPASTNALSAQMLFNALRKSGVPEALCAFSPLKRDQTIFLINSRLIDAVYWTGGSGSANEVGSACLKTGVCFIGESEGNDWAYIAPDADIDSAAKTVIHSLVENNGLMCNAINGVFVHTSIASKIYNRLKVLIPSIRLLEPARDDSEMGLVGKQTLEYLESIVVKSKAAEIISHPSKLNRHYPKIILSPANTEICYQEIFGPLLWIREINSERQLFIEYDRNWHGLGFTLFSKSKSLLAKCQMEIPVARINFNCDPLAVEMTEPWGGIRLSGSGGVREWSHKFMDSVFLNKKE